MAKVNWETAKDRLAEARDILKTLSDDNAPYIASIGAEKIPVADVIDTLDRYATQLGSEVHFYKTVISNTASKADIPEATAEKPNLFG